MEKMEGEGKRHEARGVGRWEGSGFWLTRVRELARVEKLVKIWICVM